MNDEYKFEVQFHGTGYGRFRFVDHAVDFINKVLVAAWGCYGSTYEDHPHIMNTETGNYVVYHIVRPPMLKLR